MTRRRRWTALGLAATLSFSACASASDSADSTPADPAADEPAEPVPAAELPAVGDEGSGPKATGSAVDEPAPDGAAAPDEGEQPDVAEVDPDRAAPEAAPETAPAPVPAELGGRAFAETVQPASQFDENPFPDLVVDDVGRETKANLANILPSDRPVLLWTWAPH